MPIKKWKFKEKHKLEHYDGGKKRTVYVPLTTEDMPITKKKCEEKNQLQLQDQPSTSTSADGDGGLIITESTKFQGRKERLRMAWDALRLPLLNVRVEEMGPATHECSFCGDIVEDIVYCQDCGPLAYYCEACWHRIHGVIVFHSPQIWKANMFVPMSTSNKLSRVDGHDCTTMYTSSIYAIDGKGAQHKCDVDLCRCEDPGATLLRYRLWPSSPQRPRIAFDLRFMELLTALQLECHLPAKSFCSALESVQTDFILHSHDFPKNIYRAVVGDCLTEFQYHRSCLRSRQHICDTAFGTECPICKQNPTIISLDANFGLVHKTSSGQGCGKGRHENVFFKDNHAFRNFIDDYSVDRKSKNEECSNFQAGNMIRSKVRNAKLDVTGLFGSVCKHDVPIHFIDMVHGERLGYSVYILKQLMEQNPEEHQSVVVMYDIACTLHKHLQKNHQNAILERYTFAVPVFHSFAHNMQCQLKYGQRYVSNTGLTDGEGIERLWSYLRSFKRITKEMSSVNKCDLLTEAMLHHTDHRIWNLDDVHVAERWLGDWRIEAAKGRHSATTLSEDELYVECMYQASKKRQQLQTEDLHDEEKGLIEQDIERIEKQITKLAKKVDGSLKSRTLSFESGSGDLAILMSAISKRKTSCLQRLRQHATERQYLSDMMKKYADGQNLGKRISHMFNANNVKIKKDLDVINGLDFCDQLDFTMVASPVSLVYNTLESSALSADKQRAAEAFSLRSPALEEISVCKIELQQFHAFLLSQGSDLHDNIVFNKSLPPSRYVSGKIQYLCVQLFKIEQLWRNCEAIFTSEGIDTTNFVLNIYNVLKYHLVHQERTLLVTDVEMQEILENLCELETEDQEDLSDDEEDHIEV